MDLDLRYNIQKDLFRFSKLHDWYRLLPLEGTNFLMFPWQGQQPKNDINPEVTDNLRYHWRIWDSGCINEIPITGRGKEIIMQHRVKFNCFLRGLDNIGEGGDESCPGFKNVSQEVFKGWGTLLTRYPDLEKIMREKHPEAGGNSNTFALLESQSQLENAKETAHKILDLMASDCPEWLGLSPAWKREMGIVTFGPTKEEEFFEESPLMLPMNEILPPRREEKSPQKTKVKGHRPSSLPLLANCNSIPVEKRPLNSSRMASPTRKLNSPRKKKAISPRATIKITM